MSFLRCPFSVVCFQLSVFNCPVSIVNLSASRCAYAGCDFLALCFLLQSFSVTLLDNAGNALPELGGAAALREDQALGTTGVFFSVDDDDEGQSEESEDCCVFHDEFLLQKVLTLNTF